jgi:branched-chain amino acid transport system substrate-binding protein
VLPTSLSIESTRRSGSKGQAMKQNKRWFLAAVSAALMAGTAIPVSAQKKYDTGASDSEIVIGSTQPLSGPASSYAALGKTMQAYFQMINDQGGINGRKVRFILYDDGYTPSKTVEMTRKLVEQDEVLLTTGSLGTALQLAVAGFMNQRKIPQLFVSAPGSKLANPKAYPWTINYSPTYEMEGAIYAAHLQQTKPGARIGVLYQDDEAGKALSSGFLQTLAKSGVKPVSEQTYQITDPTVDSQIIRLMESGVDTVFLVSVPRVTAQAIRKIAALGWKPTLYVSAAGASVKNALEHAGLENAIGVISADFRKRLSDPRWANDPDMKAYQAFMAKYMPAAAANDEVAANGYDVAVATSQILKMAGDDLTRANIMKIVSNLKAFKSPLTLPTITFDVTPDDYLGFKRMQVVRFDGAAFQPMGAMVTAK